jgi:hypothetical protein
MHHSSLSHCRTARIPQIGCVWYIELSTKHGCCRFGRCLASTKHSCCGFRRCLVADLMYLMRRVVFHSTQGCSTIIRHCHFYFSTIKVSVADQSRDVVTNTIKLNRIYPQKHFILVSHESCCYFSHERLPLALEISQH